tara:strand:- start:848 stop:1045 length:198 start_codon:yes stop_codon:yes gene_type:complete
VFEPSVVGPSVEPPPSVVGAESVPVLAAVSTEAEEVSEEAGAEPSVLVAAPSAGVSFSLILSISY